MHWNDLVGFGAALAVLASFCMSSIVPLRAVAVLSNVLFMTYGALGHIHPVLFLHAALLPINLIKLHQLVRPQQPHSSPGQIAIQNTGHLRPRHHQVPSPTTEIIHSRPS
jgi:hypothetical protein